MKIGYARVSSNTQVLELQKEELLKAGFIKIVSESISGKDNKRTHLMAILESLLLQASPRYYPWVIYFNTSWFKYLKNI